LGSPQNTPEDIAQLCKTTEATHLFFHPSMQKAAASAASNAAGTFDVMEIIQDPPAVVSEEAEKCRSGLTPQEESEMECIIFHSSGSSGTPKVSLLNFDYSAQYGWLIASVLLLADTAET
jgi:acyl-coenzyme A synthetase/AMP-(fatty) acid ligase